MFCEFRDLKLILTGIWGIGFSDYRRMDEMDQYESVGLDDSAEDERDLDQIMADRRAAELELDKRDGVPASRKLPHLLHDQGTLVKLLSQSILGFGTIRKDELNLSRKWEWNDDDMMMAVPVLM